MKLPVVGSILAPLVFAAACTTTEDPSASRVPSCVTREFAPPRDAAFIPALKPSPTQVGPGGSVTIRGEGFPASAPLHLVAIFGEGRCEIDSTFGSTFIANVSADAAGRVDAAVEWPATFDPYGGLEQSRKGRPLPAGRYFLYAGPCSRAWASGAYCPTLPKIGSAPGEPVTYTPE